MTMTLVSSIQVGAGGAASIEFTGIPQTGTDLVVMMSARSGSTSNVVYLQFNNDTTETNYTYRYVLGNGASASSFTANNSPAAVYTPSSATASTFANTQIYVPNYTGSTAKSASIDGVTENNATTALQEIRATVWTGTAAVTSLKLIGAGNFVQYSQASLYTITKGSGGATVS